MDSTAELTRELYRDLTTALVPEAEGEQQGGGGGSVPQGDIIQFRADTGIVKDGSNIVASWDEVPGRSGEAIATSTGNPTHFATGGSNGHAYINFSGDAISGPWLTSHPNPYRIFLVFRANNASLDYPFYDGYELGKRHYFGQAGSGWSAGSPDDQQFGAEDLNWNFSSILYAPTGAAEFRINGVAEGSGDTGGDGSTGIYIGGDYSASVFSEVDISELIVDKAPTDQRRDNIEAYLSSRYGIFAP